MKKLIFSILILLLMLTLVNTPVVRADTTVTAAPLVCNVSLFYSGQDDLLEASATLSTTPDLLMANLCNSRFAELAWVPEAVQVPVITPGISELTFPIVIEEIAPQMGGITIPETIGGLVLQGIDLHLFYNDLEELTDASQAYGISKEQLLTNLWVSMFSRPVDQSFDSE